LQVGLSKQALNSSPQGPAIATCMQSMHASVVGPNEQINPPPVEVVAAVVVEDADTALTLVAETLVAETLVAETLVAETLVAAALVAGPLVADATTTVDEAPPDPPSSSSRTRTLEPHAPATTAASVKAIASLITGAC
jgi:hypothetical protein